MSRLLSLLLWWAAGLALYLALVPTVSTAEIVAGGLLALGAAGVAALAAEAFGAPPRPANLRWRHLWWLPADIARDTCSMVGALARHLLSWRGLDGRFDELELTVPGDGDARSPRAFGVLMLSVSPSCYVADVDVREEAPDVVRVHRFGRPNRTERVVGR
jgi:hypothetical protein